MWYLKALQHSINLEENFQADQFNKAIRSNTMSHQHARTRTAKWRLIQPGVILWKLFKLRRCNSETGRCSPETDETSRWNSTADKISLNSDKFNVLKFFSKMIMPQFGSSGAHIPKSCLPLRGKWFSFRQIRKMKSCSIYKVHYRHDRSWTSPL